MTQLQIGRNAHIVEEPPPLVRTRPQHVTAAVASELEGCRLGMGSQGNIPPAEQPTNFFVTKQLSRSGTLLLTLLVYADGHRARLTSKKGADVTTGTRELDHGKEGQRPLV